MFKVIGTDTYLEEIGKWPKADRESAERLPKRLSMNPFVGDYLSFPFLREKRIRERRVYFLIYEDLRLVLVVATSGKKDQQVTINHIKSQLHEYRKAAEKVSRQVS